MDTRAPAQPQVSKTRFREPVGAFMLNNRRNVNMRPARMDWAGGRVVARLRAETDTDALQTSARKRRFVLKAELEAQTAERRRLNDEIALQLRRPV